LGRKINMNDIDMPIQWQEGSGESVEIGYFNPNGQQCCYKTECTICGYVYGTNGSDMHERRCPECQNGAPGIKYWRTIKG
jgi:rubredoxin